MSTHEHTKVYSGERHLTSIPKWFWVCLTCNTYGTTTMVDRPEPIDLVAFSSRIEVLERFPSSVLREDT